MSIVAFVASSFRAEVLALASGKFGVQIVDSVSGFAGPVSTFAKYEAAASFAAFIVAESK